MSNFNDNEELQRQADIVLQELNQLDYQKKQNIIKTKESLKDWIISTINNLIGGIGYIDRILNEIQIIIEKTLGLR